MASAGMRMQAYVALKAGMKMLYDCPDMSMESIDADAFFRKYGGKTATIVSFPSTPVGPLDKLGRLPGLYLRPTHVNVTFEGEETVRRMSLHFFVLLDPTTTLPYDEYQVNQRVGDLPHPILFYQGDMVYKTGDLLQEPRCIVDVQFGKKGELLYILSETPDAKAQRNKTRAEERRKSQEEADNDPAHIHFAGLSIMSEFPHTEMCRGEELTLLNRGKVFSLYCEPELFFDSVEEERAFWSQDGISKRAHGGGRSLVSSFAWTLARATEMVEQGHGDFVTLTDKVFRDGSRKYQVRRLHDCFSKHQERVRNLPPPVDDEA